MADDLDDALSGVDAARALPADVRTRLETVLLDRALFDHDVHELGALADALLADGNGSALGDDDAPSGLVDLDSPRAMPASLEELLLSRLAGGSRPAWWRHQSAMAIAAMIIAVVVGAGVLAAVGRDHAPSHSATVAVGRVRTTALPPAVRSSEKALAERALTPAPAPFTTIAGQGASPAAAVGDAGTLRSLPRDSASDGAVAAGSGSPPPFAYGQTGAAAPPAAATSPAAGNAGGAETPPAAPASVRIGFVGGDASMEAGFRAYVDAVNRAGGVNGRSVELTGGTPSGVLAQVNLSDGPLRSAGSEIAVLDATTTAEAALTGVVYDLSSALDRQAHVLADAVFPSDSPSATATIFETATGPYHDVAPTALAAILKARRVAVTRVVYEPGKTEFAATSAAFVSLPPDGARTFVEEANHSGYAPKRGIAGFSSMFVDRLASGLPAGSRVVLPYRVPAAGEADALTTGSGRPIDGGTLHGWVTAKALIVAIWKSGAETASEVPAALDNLTGYDAGGLMPPYAVRANTHSRTPEGIIYSASDGTFTPDGDFRSDPR